MPLSFGTNRPSLSRPLSLSRSDGLLPGTVSGSGVQNTAACDLIEYIDHLIHSDAAFRVIPTRKPLPHTHNSVRGNLRVDVLSKHAGLLSPDDQGKQRLVVGFPKRAELAEFRFRSYC